MRSLPVEFVGPWRRVGRDGYVRVEADGFAIEVSAVAAGFGAVKYGEQDGDWVETGQVGTDG